MKKITLLVISILLFTVVYAAENPVRIFAKNKLQTKEDCSAISNMLKRVGCFDKWCKSTGIVNSALCFQQVTLGDTECIDSKGNLRISSPENREYCSGKNLYYSTPEDIKKYCTDRGYLGCKEVMLVNFEECQPVGEIIDIEHAGPPIVCRSYRTEVSCLDCTSGPQQIVENCDCTPDNCRPDKLFIPVEEPWLEGEEAVIGTGHSNGESVGCVSHTSTDYSPCAIDNNDEERGCRKPCTKLGSYYCCPTGEGRETGWTSKPCYDFCGEPIPGNPVCEETCDYEDECKISDYVPPPDDNGGIKIPCPYLYSITKDGKVFEETLLEVQFSSKMNLPYYSRLDNYDPDVRKIQISEPFFETAYIDSIKLFKVNEDVLVTSTGDFYSVKEPQPVLCKSKNGDDCTALISKEDSSYYSPFNKLDSRVIKPSDYGVNAYITENIDINDESTYKDYLELTLPKKNGKLIVSYSLNPKLASFESRLVEDIKDILPIVYSSIENSFIADKVNKKLFDVGFAHLQEYDGEWKDTGEQFISYTQKEAVLPFDSNKVRIEFLSGMYVFDYIAVDYSDAKIIVEEMPLKTDIKDLKEQDDSYIILSKGDSLEIEFERSDGPGTGTDKNIKLESKFSYEEFKLMFDILFKKNFAEKYVLNLILE